MASKDSRHKRTPGISTEIMWQPGCNLEVIRARAELLADIRQFFRHGDLLEVQTALLSRTTVTDPQLHSIPVPQGAETWYLQTSPEHQMKRLLAAGAPGIYQICAAFRQEEKGSSHNPEFTLLEWYRPGYSMAQLMAEVASLVRRVLPDLNISRITYCELFQRHFELNPHRAKEAEVRRAAAQHLGEDCARFDSSALLDLLFDQACGQLSGGVFITDYPLNQTALARGKVSSEGISEGIEVAERFELVVDGLEIANGYLELLDADVAATRMQGDLQLRGQKGLVQTGKDTRLLAAMAAGLPDCAGVALGVDRLLMLQLGISDISAVLSFPYTRA